MGVLDLYGITPQPNHIKMGTLGKAYGSFGAFVLGSEHIVEYLLNRAKPLIYATSLSLYDTLLAHNSLRFIIKNKEQLKEQIKRRQASLYEILGIEAAGLIAPLVIGDNTRVIEIKKILETKSYSVGAIRQPTVPYAIIRLIARLGESEVSLRGLCNELVDLR